MGVNANAFPFLVRKARGAAACPSRRLRKGTTITHLHQQWERPTAVVSRHGPRNEWSVPSAAEVCWHPPHLSGLSEEEVEREGEALTPNLQLYSFRKIVSLQTVSLVFFLLLALQNVEHL